MIALVVGSAIVGLLAIFLIGWAIAEICGVGLHDEPPGPGAGR